MIYQPWPWDNLDYTWDNILFEAGAVPGSYLVGLVELCAFNPVIWRN